MWRHGLLRLSLCFVLAMGGSLASASVFVHNFDMNGDYSQFLLQTVDAKVWDERPNGFPVRYWAPTATGLEGQVIYQYDLPFAAKQATLYANTLPNLGIGHVELDVSPDGVGWTTVQSGYVHPEANPPYSLPKLDLSDLLRDSSTAFVRARMMGQQLNSDIFSAQFLRTADDVPWFQAPYVYQFWASSEPRGRQVWDLAEDWSDTRNPNGVWSYNAAPGVPLTSHHADWDPTREGFGGAQPAWAAVQVPAGGHVPAWLRSVGTPPGSVHDFDLPVGRVGVHGSEVLSLTNEPTPTEATWTSPIDGFIEIEGDAWLMRKTLGRPMDWALYLNDSLLTDGSLLPTDPYNSTSPFDLANGSGGPTALRVPVQIGDVVSLQIVKPGADLPAEFVGVDLRITEVPEPWSLVLALIGCAISCWLEGKSPGQPRPRRPRSATRRPGPYGRTARPRRPAPLNSVSMPARRYRQFKVNSVSGARGRYRRLPAIVVCLLSLVAGSAQAAPPKSGSSSFDRRGAALAPGTTRYYDGHGRLEGSSRTGSDGQTQFYDRQGRWSGRAAPQPSGTTTYYDQRGAVAGRSRDSGAGATHYTDRNGRPAGHANPSGQDTRRFYDAQGHPAGRAMTSPGGRTSYYDSSGRYSGSARTTKPR